MATVEIGDLTNGKNGHTAESDARKMIAVMAVTGSISDAQSVYVALGLDDWSEFERVITPLRRFVQDGETPYVRMVPVVEYRGTPTPEGDCADDALPLEARNVARARVRAMMVGDTSSK